MPVTLERTYAQPPAEEAERLAALRALGILDTPPEERFNRITRLAAELFDVPIAYVSFVDENREWYKACCGWNTYARPRETALCDEVLAREDLLVIPDARADARFRNHPMVVETPHVRFYAGRSLRSVLGTAVGTFSVADQRARTFGPSEQRLFDVLAQMAEHELRLVDMIELQLDLIRTREEAEAANRARVEAMDKVVENQQHLADELQRAARYVRSLLPEPETGPIETQWLFIPSDELGGDAFGYHWLDEEHFAMYLLDVTGHGIGAALHSVSVLNVLRTQTLRHADYYEPSEVLAALNEAFQMKDHDNLYFTIWYGVYHSPTRRLTYASGGHLPGLLVNTGEGKPEVVRLRTGGPLMGGVRRANFPSTSHIVPEGSALYLFSDGVYEVRQADGTMMDLEQFIGLLSQDIAENGGEVEPLVQRIHQAHNCRRCADDVSLLRVTFH